MTWPVACSCRAVQRHGLCSPRATPLALLFLLSLLCLSCTKAPTQRFDLESLKVTGNSELDDEEIEEHIASRETPRFLGLFPGVIYDYETFNRFVLERDLQRIERLYRSRGYYQARARAAHVFRSGSKVRVEIVVEEGEPVLLRRVDLHGIERLPKDLQAKARRSVTALLPLEAPLEKKSSKKQRRRWRACWVTTAMPSQRAQERRRWATPERRCSRLLGDPGPAVGIRRGQARRPR